MVSNASDDLPDPDSPVTQTSAFRGMRTVTFFRLCSRAPWTTSSSAWLIGASFYRVEQTFDSDDVGQRAVGFFERGRRRPIAAPHPETGASPARPLAVRDLDLAANLAAGVLRRVDVH